MRLGGGLLLTALLTQLLFPGQRSLMAVTLATGIGRSGMQQRIDKLEAKAIADAPFTAEDQEFLRDFYATLATGGTLSVVLRQTGGLMRHYLGRSGKAYKLQPSIFTGNERVQRRAAQLRARASSLACDGQESATSKTFYMPDRSNLDSVFGLYYGRLLVTPSPTADGCELRFRAEVPWQWPSYRDLQRKYGDPHAESFPVPNIQSLLRGPRYSLYVDNGLGQHLEQLGLAKSFIAFAEWTEPAR